MLEFSLPQLQQQRQYTSQQLSGNEPRWPEGIACANSRIYVAWSTYGYISAAPLAALQVEDAMSAAEAETEGAEGPAAPTLRFEGLPYGKAGGTASWGLRLGPDGALYAACEYAFAGRGASYCHSDGRDVGYGGGYVARLDLKDHGETFGWPHIFLPH